MQLVEMVLELLLLGERGNGYGFCVRLLERFHDLDQKEKQEVPMTSLGFGTGSNGALKLG